MKRWPVIELDWDDAAFPAQAPKVLEHLVSTFNDREKYGPERLAQEIRPPLAPQRKQFFMVTEGERILGVAGVKSADWASKAWILYLSAVVPEARGRGIGRSLVEARLRWIKSQQAHGRILVSTAKPRRFRVFGFRQMTREAREGRHLMLLEY